MWFLFLFQIVAEDIGHEDVHRAADPQQRIAHQRTAFISCSGNGKGKDLNIA